MIDAKRIYKTGRESRDKKSSKVFVVSDSLQVNDFFNEGGRQYSSLHGKYSRIKFNIIDTSKGSKDKALVGTFNFTLFEWSSIARKLKLNGGIFHERVKKISSTKTNPYKKIGEMIEIRSIIITFEVGLNNPKWKIVITTGKAMATEDFGYDSKSYVKLYETNFMLDEIEKEEMLFEVEKFITLWEQSNFPIFIRNRDEFFERAKKNNFDEKTIKKWNAKISTTENSFSSRNGTQNNENICNQLGCNCSVCGQAIDKSNADIIKNSFGRYLCPECLKTHIGNNN